MADSRLTRQMNKDEAAAWLSWFKSAKQPLAEIARVLDAEIAGSDRTSDKAECFKDVNALAGLAHQAGYREGLRAALKLLTDRG